MLFNVSAQEFSDGYIAAIVSYQQAVAQGDTLPVSIKIIKNDINGFAKFKCSAQRGLQILSPDFVNASATIKDTILEVIWVEIPFEKEFLIDYQIVIPNISQIGRYTFSGSFYYLIDKDVKVLKFNNLEFTVSDDKNIVKKSEKDFLTETVKREKNKRPVLMSKDDRQIPFGDSTTNLQTHISNLNEIPDVPLVEDKKTTEPTVEIPKIDTIEQDSVPKIETPIVEEAKPQDSIAPTPIVVQEQPKPVDTLTSNSPTITEQPKQDTVSIKPEPSPKVEEPKKNEVPVVAQTQSTSEGVEFRLQIAASKKVMTAVQLKKIYKGSLKVEEEIRGDGWYRYIILKSGNYAEVRKEKIKCGVADAFISATSNGKAISVSEALRNAKPNEVKSYGKIFYAVQAIAVNSYMPISEFKEKFKTDRLIFIEKDAPYYKYLIGYFTSFREANEYRKQIGGDSFVVSYMNGKRLDKVTTLK